MKRVKTWVEINKDALKHNIGVFRGLLRPETKLWAVVKSNAYGHGLLHFSKLAEEYGVDGFCVDSLIEGIKLRQEGIAKPILVLGPVFPEMLEEAEKNKISVTISTLETLEAAAKLKNSPEFHLKIDTGMHRQGFYLEQLKKVVQIVRDERLEIRDKLKGIYTHFAAAKDVNYPTFTDLQFHDFKKAAMVLEEAGFKGLIRHAAATGGVLISPEYHLDAVRIGIGLQGIWPSRELEMQKGKEIELQPVLSWYALVSEVKPIKKGDFIGYDLVERIYKPTEMAIVPIGYWHGYPRALSGVGEVLINGKRCRVLGRVSMDLIVVDAGEVKAKAGDVAVLIGSQKSETIFATEVAAKMNASPYELITRINPLIERFVA